MIKEVYIDSVAQGFEKFKKLFEHFLYHYNNTELLSYEKIEFECLEKNSTKNYFLTLIIILITFNDWLQNHSHIDTTPFGSEIINEIITISLPVH